MNIRLDDGQVVEVWISDAYADEATVGKVKQAYLTKHAAEMQEIESLMARARALGLEINMPSPQAAPAPAAPAPDIIRPAQAAPVAAATIVPTAGNRVVDGRVADQRQLGTMVHGSVSMYGASVSGGGSEYKITSADKPSTDLKDGEIAEIGRVKGRDGNDIAIPVRRVGRTGETRVTIVNSGTDADLQRKFKELGRRSVSDDPSVPDFLHSGYQVKTVQCPLCRGTGVVQGGQQCPKCGGLGAYDVDA